LRRVTVYAGSRNGKNPAYAQAAAQLGTELAARGIGVIYGGGKTGLMGAMSDAVIAAGGELIGIMPQWLVDKEIAHPGVTDFRVTDSMHERKKMMADMADAFIALPGGFGTMDELFEVLTWAQIGLHDKPVGLLDAAGYFAPFVTFANHVAAEGFIAKEHARLYVVEQEADTLVSRLASFEPPPMGNPEMDRRGKP
jgi:hypothetical protein